MRRVSSTISGRAKFPGGTEKCREFRRFSRFLRKSVSKTSANAKVCEQIPYADEQGIFLQALGISSAVQGIAGNLREIDPCARMCQISFRLWIIKYPTSQMREIHSFNPQRGADCRERWRSRDVASSRTRGSRTPDLVQLAILAALQTASGVTPSPHRAPTAGYTLSRVRPFTAKRRMRAFRGGSRNRQHSGAGIKRRSGTGFTKSKERGASWR